MLELTITNGGIKARKAGTTPQTFVRWPDSKWVFPCNQYAYTPPHDLMPCEDYWKALKEEGYSNDAILDKMILLYIPWYNFNVGHLANISTVLGFIGHRGACKTASAVYNIVFDYSIRGLPVFSNIEIAVRVRYRDCMKEFRSQPWSAEDLLSLEGKGGVVLVDEINLAAASSQKSQSNANYDWNNDLQQLRKKRLNVIYSAQSWSTIDPHTRWQTDWVIECQDCFNDHSYKARCPGDKTKWSVYELSGLSGQFDLAYELEHRNLLHYKIGETRMVWISPIAWWAYDTYQAQDPNYFKKYKLRQAQADHQFKTDVRSARIETALSIVEQIDAITDEKIYLDDIAITDRTLQTEVGILLKKKYEKKRDTAGERRYYYVRRGPNEH